MAVAFFLINSELRMLGTEKADWQQLTVEAVVVDLERVIVHNNGLRPDR